MSEARTEHSACRSLSLSLCSLPTHICSSEPLFYPSNYRTCFLPLCFNHPQGYLPKSQFFREASLLKLARAYDHTLPFETEEGNKIKTHGDASAASTSVKNTSWSPRGENICNNTRALCSHFRWRKIWLGEQLFPSFKFLAFVHPPLCITVSGTRRKDTMVRRP